MTSSLDSFVPNAHFLYHLGGKKKEHLEKMINPNKTDGRSVLHGLDVFSKEKTPALFIF